MAYGFNEDKSKVEICSKRLYLQEDVPFSPNTKKALIFDCVDTNGTLLRHVEEIPMKNFLSVKTFLPKNENSIVSGVSGVPSVSLSADGKMVVYNIRVYFWYTGQIDHIIKKNDSYIEIAYLK